MNKELAIKILIYCISIYIEKIGLAMLIWWYAIISVFWALYLSILQDFLHSIFPYISAWTWEISLIFDCQGYLCIASSSTREYIWLWTFLFFIIWFIESMISLARKKFFSIVDSVTLGSVIFILLSLYIVSILSGLIYYNREDKNLPYILYIITPLIVVFITLPNILIWSFLFFWVWKVREKLFRSDTVSQN